MEQWYKVQAYKAHYGTGKRNDVTIYIFTDTIINALERFKRIPGIKRGLSRGKFPDIFPLSDKEATELEGTIEAERRVSLQIARETWYYAN